MLRKYSLTLVNQGLVSLFNFALGIVLVRHWGRFDYGVFVLIVQVGLSLESVQNALVTAPLSVYVPALERRIPRQLMEALLASTSALLIAFATLGSFLFALLTLGTANTVLTAAVIAAYIASVLTRSFTRSYFYTHLQPTRVAVSDLTYVAVGTMALAVVWHSPDTGNLLLVLAALSVGGSLGALVAYWSGQATLRLSWRRKLLRRYGEPWRDARWALLGVTTTTLQTRAHTLIVTTAFGPETFAVLAAGQLLFGPIRTAMMAWGMIMRPHLARAYGRRDRREIIRNSAQALAGMAVAFAVFGTLLYVFWQPIQAQLYGDKYQDMSLIVALWAGVTVLFSIRAITSFSLQSMRAFRELAFASCYGAVISLCSVGLIVAVAGFEYSIVGIALGEIFLVYYQIRLFRGRVRKVPDNRGTPEAVSPSGI